MRKLSKSTAASSCSSDSTSQPSNDVSNLEGLWCPKCENFYKNAQIIAKKCGFRLCGDLYGKSLKFKCLKAQHSTKISYSKRLQGNMSCAACRKEEREAAKERLREEERIQDAYYAELQE